MVKVFYHKDQLVPAMSIFVLNAVFCQALKNEVLNRCCCTLAFMARLSGTWSSMGFFRHGFTTNHAVSLLHLSIPSIPPKLPV